MKIVLSVIIATYNGSQTLPEVLRTLADIEAPRGGWKLIIADNGSTDSTKEVITSFAESLPLEYVFVPQRGQNAARNAVLSLAPKAGLVVQAVNYHELDRVLIRIENVRVCPGFDGMRHVVPAVRMAGTDVALCDECDKITKSSILTPLGASESGIETPASDVPPTATTRP